MSQNTGSIIFLSIIAFSGVLTIFIPAWNLVQKLIIITFLFFVLMLKIHRTSVLTSALFLITPLFLYFLYALISVLSYAESFLYVLAAIQPIVLCLLLYMWFCTLNIHDFDYQILIKFFYVLIFIQFAFALIKFIVDGVDEDFLIGTMSNNAGQLSFLLPAMVISLCVFLMRFGNRYVNFILMSLMFLFSIIGEKRVGVFLLPIIIFFSIFLIDSKKIGSFFSSKKVLLGISLSFIGAIIGLSVIPSLNSGGINAADISIVFAVDYALDYLTMDYGGNLQGSYDNAHIDRNIQVGRITLLLIVFEWLLSSELDVMFFGIGYGAVTPSQWLGHSRDILFETIGDRGAISGFGLALIETGLLGATIISSFFIFCFLSLFREYRRLHSVTAKSWYKMIFIMLCIFCFDFFIYSTVLLRTMPMPLIFMWAMGSIFIVRKMDSGLMTKNLSIN